MELRKWIICEYCKGDGWTTEHDSPSRHSEDGECLTCPLQEGCDKCQGTGKVLEEKNPPEIKKEIDTTEIPF